MNCISTRRGKTYRVSRPPCSELNRYYAVPTSWATSPSQNPVHHLNYTHTVQIYFPGPHVVNQAVQEAWNLVPGLDCTMERAINVGIKSPGFDLQVSDVTDKQKQEGDVRDKDDAAKSQRLPRAMRRHACIPELIDSTSIAECLRIGPRAATRVLVYTAASLALCSHIHRLGSSSTGMSSTNMHHCIRGLADRWLPHSEQSDP